LGRHVKSRDSLAVRSSAKSGLLIDVRAMIQQPCDGFRTIAHRSPDERRASIRIGVQARTRPDEPLQHEQAVTLACPHKCFVKNLLRVCRRLPVRETAMRTVEASGGARFGSECAIRFEAGIYQLRNAEPGSGTKIVWSHRMATQQIGYLAMSPEQREN